MQPSCEDRPGMNAENTFRVYRELSAFDSRSERGDRAHFNRFRLPSAPLPRLRALGLP